MPLDPSIIMSGQAPKLDSPMDIYSKGLSMKNMIQQSQMNDQAIAEKQSMKDLYSKNLVTNPDGTQTVNKKGLVSGMYGIDPTKAMEAEQNFAKMDFEQQQRTAETAKQLAWSIGPDQESWAAQRQKAIELGMPNADKLPEQHPGMEYVKRMQMNTLKAEEQLAQANYEKDYILKKRAVAADELRAQRVGRSGENLPIDAKKKVERLSTGTADKISIKNQIDAVLKNWDSLPEDQKVYAGQQLIKTLNSTQGQDAVGNQERDVLAGKLQFAMGNFTNKNPTQFGRDLEGFKEQAANVSKALETAIQSNKDEIDITMGRQPAPQQPNKQFNAPLQIDHTNKDIQAAAKKLLEQRNKQKQMAGK